MRREKMDARRGGRILIIWMQKSIFKIWMRIEILDMLARLPLPSLSARQDAARRATWRFLAALAAEPIRAPARQAGAFLEPRKGASII